MTNSGKGNRGKGFASMDKARQREIASAGGKASHASGRGHEFTSEEAAIAGKKGGEAVSRNRQHMAEIGRQGGQARGQQQSSATNVVSGEQEPPNPLP
ncbi:MAG: hypothetical protein J0M12_12880 [Deltaproteobacteria bacterium]|nr:hypothetical protein [Deltaproteobacteria bacterium]